MKSWSRVLKAAVISSTVLAIGGWGSALAAPAQAFLSDDGATAAPVTCRSGGEDRRDPDHHSNWRGDDPQGGAAGGRARRGDGGCASR
jgi:hypothetical protein